MNISSATRAVATSEAPSAIGPYSQAIQAGNLLFVSGQIGLDPATGQMVPGGLAPQARRALDNLFAIVRAGGGSPETIVAVDVFLTDMKRFSEFNDIYEAAFAGYRPARAVVEVGRLPKDAEVEIKCIALSA